MLVELFRAGLRGPWHEDGVCHVRACNSPSLVFFGEFTIVVAPVDVIVVAVEVVDRVGLIQSLQLFSMEPRRNGFRGDSAASTGVCHVRASNVRWALLRVGVE